MKNYPLVIGASAFDTLNNLFSQFFTKMDGSLKGIGLGISSLVFVVTGIVLVSIAIICAWQVKNNNGVSEVWENHSTKIFIIIGITAASGLISLAFFGAA